MPPQVAPPYRPPTHMFAHVCTQHTCSHVTHTHTQFQPPLHFHVHVTHLHTQKAGGILPPLAAPPCQPPATQVYQGAGRAQHRVCAQVLLLIGAWNLSCVYPGSPLCVPRASALCVPKVYLLCAQGLPCVYVGSGPPLCVSQGLPFSFRAQFQSTVSEHAEGRGPALCLRPSAGF